VRLPGESDEAASAEAECESGPVVVGSVVGGGMQSRAATIDAAAVGVQADPTTCACSVRADVVGSAEQEAEDDDDDEDDDDEVEQEEEEEEEEDCSVKSLVGATVVVVVDDDDCERVAGKGPTFDGRAVMAGTRAGDRLTEVLGEQVREKERESE
jgi:hypothetical protein